MKFKPLYTLSGGGTASANPYACKASQTIAVGDIVSMDVNGQVSKCTKSDSTAPMWASGANWVVGVAASSVTDAAANDQILVWDDPNQVYLATSVAATQTKVGATSDIANTTQVLDLAGSGSDALTVVDLWSNRSADGANTQVLCKITHSKHIFSAGEGA